MRTPVAWRNLMHNKRRTSAVVAGVGFAILLLFMQLGFYGACRLNATMVYDMLEFDAVVVSPTYVFLMSPGSVGRARVVQARAVPGVRSASPVYFSLMAWLNLEDGNRHSIQIVGVNPTDRPFRDQAVNDGLPLVSRLDTTLMDQASSRIYGPRTVGSETEIHGHRVRVVGEYRHGAGFIASGSMVVSDRTFARISDFGDVERPSMGLIRWEPGAPPEETLRLLRASLPADVVVWSREELERREQHLFMTVKPIGIMFTSGAIIAFLVGAVILFQILTTEVAHRRREYATLRAMGYTSWDLKRLVLEEGFFMVAMGFLPAGLLSWYLYGVVNAAVKLPLFMSWDRVATVLALSLLMGGGSGLLAIRKVNAADPAELF